MAHHPEWLTEGPGREGVCREALVIKRDAGLEVGILQVAVESAQGRGHGESLVTDESAGEGGDVKIGLLLKLTLNFPSNEEEETLEVVGIDIGRTADEEMGDHGLGIEGQFAQFIRINGDLTPPDERDVASGENRFGEGLNLIRSVFREEIYPDCEIVGRSRVAKSSRSLGKNGPGNLAKDAGAVSGFHISIHSSTVGHVADRGDGVIDDLVGLLAIKVGNSAHTAVCGFIVPLVEGSGAIGSVTRIVKVHYLEIKNSVQKVYPFAGERDIKGE